MSGGSNWQIWDLHLHTPCSILNNGFGSPEEEETWEKYVSEIEKNAAAKNIVAIGVTDYFTIEGYKHLLQQQQRGRLQGILLIPNIEFRVDKVIVQEKGTTKRVNLHVLFSPDIPPDVIEERFLHDLDFVFEDDPFEPATARRLKLSNLTEFGEKLKKQHERFGSYTPLEVAGMTAVVSTDGLKKALQDRGFAGKYLLVLAEEGIPDIGWDSQGHAVRKQLYQMSHALFSANEKTRHFCLGKTHATPEAYLEEFKSYKPCIWGCDSHSLTERFLEPDLGKYCWIKAEATWEGLKQILYEPEHRVRIQRDNPEPPKSIYTVSGIQITGVRVNQALGLGDFETALNPNLVTIIGGRGSGKTALLDLIASVFPEGVKLSMMENSFFHRLYVSGNSARHVPNAPIRTKVEFQSGEAHEKAVGQDDGVFEKTNIIYLTQDHFDEFSANPDKLNEHVIDLVFQSFVEERRKYEELGVEINHLVEEVQHINLEIEQLQTETSGVKQQAEANHRQKSGERDDYLKRLSKITADEQDRGHVITGLTQELDRLRSRKRDTESLLYLLARLSEAIATFHTEYSAQVGDVNQALGAFTADGAMLLPAKIAELTELQHLLSQDRLILTAALTEATEAHSATEAKVEELEGVGRVIADLQQKINDCALELQEIEARIHELETKQALVETLDKKRYEAYARIMSATVSQRMFLQSMITKFEEGKADMLSSLSFNAVVDTKRHDELLELLLDKVDNRSHSAESLELLLLPIVEQMDALMNQETPPTSYESVLDALAAFARGLHLKRSTSTSDFYNTLFRRFFSIGLRIKFSGKILSELSMGERAIVLLKILLALNDKPLLIDQPEEHLDNRYIYDDLVPAFRSAKTKRQIIIATHNANLVVNTDAEQVIIAHHTDGQLSYETTTLEDLSKREEIKTVLEGGDKAFKNREMKYGYVH